MKNLLYIGIILMLAAAFGCGNGTATDSVVEEESSEISVKRQLVPTATNVPLIEESQESSEIAPGGVFRRNWSDPPTLFCSETNIKLLSQDRSSSNPTSKAVTTSIL